MAFYTLSGTAEAAHENELKTRCASLAVTCIWTVKHQIQNWTK